VSIEAGSGNPLGTVTVLKRKNGRDDRGGLDRNEATCSCGKCSTDSRLPAVRSRTL